MCPDSACLSSLMRKGRQEKGVVVSDRSRWCRSRSRWWLQIRLIPDLHAAMILYSIPCALICAFSGSALRTHLLHWPGKVMLDSTRRCRPDKVATGCLFWKRPTLQNSKAAPRSQDLLVLQPTNSLPLFKLSKNKQQKAQHCDLKIE